MEVRGKILFSDIAVLCPLHEDGEKGDILRYHKPAQGDNYAWDTFQMGKEYNRSFKRLKDQLSSNTVLMNYFLACSTRVYVDHGPERGGFHHCPGIQQYGEERHAMEASVTYK